MTEFKRKKGESFEAFLRRFNRGLKNSKTLMVARSKRAYAPDKTKRKQKEYTLKSIELRKEKDYLRKIGKISEGSTR